jgi:hypothetical protein
MNRQLKRIVAGAWLALATTACYSLEVPTTFDDLTREAVTQDPTLIEHVLASQGVTLFAAIANRGRPWTALEVMGERLTSSSDLHNMWATSREPREQLENQVGTTAINSDPWALLYEANSSATEMQRVLRDNNLRIIDPNTQNDNTTRAIAWAKFIQGVSHGYLALLFDRAAIVNVDVDLSVVPDLPLVEYTEVRDSALKWLNESAVLAQTNTFTFPNTNERWFWNLGVTNNAFSELVNSFIARVMVYSARTPQERAEIDWNQVLIHLDRSIKTDFGLGGDGTRPDEVLNYEYKGIAFNPPGGGNGRQLQNAARADMRLLGPADTLVLESGKTQYQEWLEKVSTPDGRDTTVGFIIASPDQRIQLSTAVGNDPLKPIFFRYTTLPANGTLPGAGTPMQPPERGLYYRDSPYYSSSMLDQPNETEGGRNTSGELADIREVVFRVSEIDLLKAEALIRLNRAVEAVPLINKYREPFGGLPAVTDLGPPPGPGCVPKRWDGSCGDLWDALMYEKRIQTFGSHGLIPWADGRGWGCLLPGTLTELPIPARQLDLMGQPNYTFGGQPGQRGSAPAPDNCPMLFIPTTAGS